ncbi:hypothetical protein Goklo_021296 [Gossypium klotzschianum]|uniref:Myb/SANT-like domain-containing protein n=1 Tax=Gossypium klotzschianum TaxID=34286 RepID=A0A7J8UUS8_9ROSI|nr:hypothetical protein [Gossypium klotzschianum]
MSSFSQSSVSSQNSRGTKKKWFLEEDVTLVACMVDLYNVGIYNANTGFKVDYLNKLERMLEKVLPHAMLKAKYNLESRIRTLKNDWAIIYHMLNIVEEINVEEIATANNLEKGNNYHGCEDGVSLDEMDASATQSQSSKSN